MQTTPASKCVVFAMDAFKGTLASYRAGEAAEMGFRAFQRHCASVASAATPVIATPTTPLNFVHCPMSDGGAGLVDSLCYHPNETAKEEQGRPSASHFDRVYVPAEFPLTGPLGNVLVEEQRRAALVGRPSATPMDLNEAVSFACDVAHRVVVIEMAQTSGLPRITKPSQRSPLHTTSYGTGEMILYAVRHLQRELRRQGGDAACGVRVFVGIGGSATNDGGLGALQALGLRIFVRGDTGKDDTEQLLTRPFMGADLARVTRVEMGTEMRTLFSPAGTPHTYIAELNLICDVNNPLVGPRGATFIFGPQKCAPVAKAQHAEAEDAPVGEVGSAAQRVMLEGLEQGMTHAATKVVESLWRDAGRSGSQQRQLHDLLHAAGNGGAGGMSGFFRYVLQAAWLPGADAVAELLGMRHVTSETGRTGLLYSNCDVVVSGEGSFDSQTIYSRKTVGRLLEMAVEANLWKLEQHHRTHPNVDLMQRTVPASQAPSLIADFVILCGRCGFKSMQSCQADVLHVLRERLLSPQQSGEVDATMRVLQDKLRDLARTFSSAGQTYSAADVLRRAVPRVNVLPLSPVAFTVKQAMTDTYNCVLKRTEAFLTEEWCAKTKSPAAQLPWTQPSKL